MQYKVVNRTAAAGSASPAKSPLPSSPASPKPLLQPQSALQISRDTSLLHPELLENVTALLLRLNDEMHPFKIFEGYRSPERQQHLYDQGRATPGQIVTRAKPYESFHNYGLACDLVLFIDGKWTWDTAGSMAGHWDALRNYAAACNLETLSFEVPHVQLATADLSELERGLWPGAGTKVWFDNVCAAITGWRGKGNFTPRIPGETNGKASA